MKILSKYIKRYRDVQTISLKKHLDKIKESNSFSESLKYSIISSAVFSSMIEGNGIDLESYLKFKEMKIGEKDDKMKEIDDLIDAYKFAMKHKLNLHNVLESHKISAQTILLKEPDYIGNIRNKSVNVRKRDSHEIVYRGAPSKTVNVEINKLFEDISELISKKIPLSLVFYYASMIHLRFVQIHPFADGNGRTARLIEKWFLAEKIGKKAWEIPTEKLYKKRISSYYKNINLGDSYDNLNYEMCIPFLLMLPMALRIK